MGGLASACQLFHNRAELVEVWSTKAKVGDAEILPQANHVRFDLLKVPTAMKIDVLAISESPVAAAISARVFSRSSVSKTSMNLIAGGGPEILALAVVEHKVAHAELCRRDRCCRQSQHARPSGADHLVRTAMEA